MISIDIPGFGALTLTHLVSDVNGTLTKDGVLIPGVADRLAELRHEQGLHIHLLTADTHGNQDEIDRELHMTAHRMRPGEDEIRQKAEFVQSLGAERCVVMGNGMNDTGMLREAALAIVVLGSEGAAWAALQEADIVTTNPLDALDLLLQHRRLIASLRR